MTARPRVDCPKCGQNVALNQDGRIRKHRDPTGGSASYYRCDAAGTLTAEDARRAELARLAELVKRYPKEARDFVARLP